MEGSGGGGDEGHKKTKEDDAGCFDVAASYRLFLFT
jgi:hypothetical protein